MSSERNDDAVEQLRLTLRQSPQLGRGWEELYQIALDLADEDSSLECADRLVKAFPDNPKYKLLLAERYSRVGHSNIALDIVRQLSESAPPNPAVDYFLGVYAGQLGALELAAQCLRSAIQRKPDFGDAWSMLSSVAELSADDALELETLVASGTASALPGTAYALGDYHHRNNDFEAAWRYYTKANLTERAKAPPNLNALLAAMDDIQTIDQSLSKAEFSNSEIAPRMVFVVGAPRSGTTLIEQILARSDQIAPLGETTFSRLATWPLGDLRPDVILQRMKTNPGKTDLLRLGDIYRSLARVRSNGAPVATDKAVQLHLYVGLLARMLPDAKFVLVSRDKRDTALSCYRAYLTNGNRWRHSIPDMARYLDAHGRLMEYWKAQFPGRCMALDYEDLVTDPQTETNRMSDFCDIARIDLSSKDDRTPRPVGTASFAQVRQPISLKSVGGWRNYEPWLDPHF